MRGRWQGVPPGADASRFIRDVRTVSLDALEGALPAGVPKLDLSGRTAQIARRARLHAARTRDALRSEEHTSELQSLMRSSYAVFCLKQTHTRLIHALPACVVSYDQRTVN